MILSIAVLIGIVPTMSMTVFANAVAFDGEGVSLTTYTVTVDSTITHGTVTSNAASASAGTTVTLTVTPDAGYSLAFTTLSVSDGTNEIELTSGANNTFTFTMPAGNVTVTARFGIPNGELYYVNDDENGVTTIFGIGTVAQSASWASKVLPNVVIEEGITAIGNYAFQGCSSIESITIPASVTAIGRYVFQGCSLLTDVTYLGTTEPTAFANSFAGCSLSSVTVPAGYTGTTFAGITVEKSGASTAPTVTGASLSGDGVTFDAETNTYYISVDAANITLTVNGTNFANLTEDYAIRFSTSFMFTPNGLAADTENNVVTCEGLTADYFYNSDGFEICYSTDGGDTWTDLGVYVTYVAPPAPTITVTDSQGNEIPTDGTGILTVGETYTLTANSEITSAAWHPREADSGYYSNGSMCTGTSFAFTQDAYNVGAAWEEQTGYSFNSIQLVYYSEGNAWYAHFSIGISGTSTPANVASVTIDGTTTNYTTLADAFAAASASTGTSVTLTLLEDVTMDTRIEVDSGKFTVDLNGKTWTANTRVLCVCGIADVKITDSAAGGTIKGTTNSPTIALYDSAKLEVTGGTVENTGSVVAIDTSFSGSATSAELTVSGGKIVTNCNYAIRAYGSSVTVTGGTIESFMWGIYYHAGVIDLSGHSNPSDLMIYIHSGTTADMANFKLPDGYAFYEGDAAVTALEASKAYTVKAAATTNVASVTTGGTTTNYTDIAAAVDAAEAANGSTLKLLDNVTTDTSIYIESGSFTIDLNGKTWESSAYLLCIGGAADVTISDTSSEKSGVLRTPQISYATICLYGSANLKIEAGTVENTGVQGAIDISFSGQFTNATLTIAGGKVISHGDTAIVAKGSSITITGGIIEGQYKELAYWTGKIDLSGHSDPTGIRIVNWTDADVTPGDETIKIPAGYVFFNYSGEVETTLASSSTYTVGKAPTVIVTKPKNGTVTYTPEDAKAGDTVVLNITPNENYETDTVTVTDKDGNPVEVGEDNSFVIPEGGVTVTVTFKLDPHFHEKDGYEIVWSETFESDTLPEDFTAVDKDGDGYNWHCESGERISHDCKDDYGCLSASFINNIGVLNTQNLLQLPTFDLDSAGEYLFSFMVRALDENWPDDYNVHISLDGGETYVWSRGMAAAPANWTEITVDLTPYAGKSVTVVIEHTDSDQYYIVIDCMYLYYKETSASDAFEAIEELNKAIEDLKALINSNSASLEDINEALKDVNTALAGLDDTYVNHTELSDALASINEAIKKLNDETIPEIQKNSSANTSDITTLKNTVGAIQLTLAALAQKDSELSNSISELDTELDNLTASLTALTNRVGAAEEAIKALEAAVKALKDTDISDAESLAATIANLNKAIEDAKAFATTSDTALKNELNKKIEEADQALDVKIAAVRENLDKAVAELKAADATNTSALASAIETLNKAIDAAEAAALAGDKSLDAKITEAQTALNIKIAEVQQSLDKAKAELEEAIKNGNAALDAKIAALSNALINAEATLKAADAANRAALEVSIALAKNELAELIGGVQSDLNSTKEKLEEAIADLNQAIVSGDMQLSSEINALNAALDSAKAALEAADADNKAELVSMIETAESALDSAIDAVQKNLDDAKAELDQAIADGDNALDERISALNTALDNAKTALEAADAELESMIESAEWALDKAIEAVQKNLDDAKADLNQAIADGDNALDERISELNAALYNAKAALEAADADNKAELISKIESADAALDEAIKAVQKNLDEAKAELNKAITDGDTSLDEKITALNAALENAKTALEAADAANKTELEGKIASAQTSLKAAIDKVAKDLANAKSALEKAISNGDSDLNEKISALGTALENAISAYQAADGALKSELTAKIEAADTALDAAIKAVQKNLDDAKSALNKAISDGDSALDSKIAALSEAFAAAKAALEAADTANKTELTDKMNEAYTSLEAAVKAVQQKLDDLKSALEKADSDNKAALEEKDSELTTILIIVSAVSGVTLCGGGAFVVWFFIDRKKRIIK